MNITHLIRAFNSNLGTIQVEPGEQASLESIGVREPTVQRYVLWRRATIWMVVIATLLSAGISTVSTYTDSEDETDVVEELTEQFFKKVEGVVPAAAMLEKFARHDEEKASGTDKDDEDEAANTVGKVVDGVHLVSLCALPITALIALFLGKRWKLSYRVMLAGFFFSFFVPMLVALCPWSWWGYQEPKFSPTENPAKFVIDQAEGVVEGIATVVALLPAVLSLVPGVLKACMRVKTLLPQSILPGWLIVMAGPFYGLFLLVIFVAIDQVTAEPFIIGGFFLVVASSLVYLFQPDAFTRPLVTEADFRRMKRVQMVVTILTAAGGLLLLGYVLTREVLGVHLIGSDPKSSVMRPIEVVEYLFEIISRSMFVTALGADVFMRVNLTAWKQGKALEASGAAGNYDGAMAALDSVATS